MIESSFITDDLDFKETLERWMKVYLATVIGEPSETVNTSEPLSIFDLDSIDAITMAVELEQKFKIEASPEHFLDGTSSINAIANKIASSVAKT